MSRWVSLNTLADETGIAVRTLQYIRAQEPSVLTTRPRGKGIEYKQPDCAVALRRREVERAKRENATAMTYDEARARRAAAEAEDAELDLAVKKRQLLTVEDWESALRSALDSVRARVMALPGRLAPLVAGVDSVPSAVAVIEPVVAEVLTELASDDSPVLQEPAA